MRERLLRLLLLLLRREMLLRMMRGRRMLLLLVCRIPAVVGRGRNLRVRRRAQSSCAEAAVV